jgi:hypothetical protein
MDIHNRRQIMRNLTGILVTITGFRYNETNVMHFSFNLLGIKGLYMFRTLLAHPQEALTSGTWYIACVLCQLAATRIGVELVFEDEQVMLETYRCP